MSAARAGVPVGASSAVVNAIRQEPYISVQNASGQTVTVPSHFSNIAEAAKNFIRRMCDAEMQRIETQRAVEQAQQKILSDTVHSAGNAISAFYKAWNANANYWHDYYNNATNVGDFLYGGVNYFTYGLIDGINKSYQQRHQEMLDDFTLYNIANWGLSGIPDRVKGAIAPEDPLSLQHWLDSFSVVMIGYGLYQGYQFANAPANTINTAHPVTGTGMLDDFADDAVRYREGVPVTPSEKTLEMALNPELYANEVAKKYGINLRGSGQDIVIEFNPQLTSLGRTRASNPNVIEIGPSAFVSESELANTIAHELNHARSFLAGGNAPEWGSNGAYLAGDALADYIAGGR